ncbi:MAG TPA: DUF305 domain-containing protein [Longimicrobiales bacterium]|nr:DUF305 domain-containing protein [Longimicrobiales bacterium]
MIPARSIGLPLLLLAACAGRAAEPPASGTPASGTPASPATADAARVAAQADSARSAYTQTDVAFMAGMIHHHAQALTMSRMAADRGASDPLQILAARIINAQRDEIRLMQDWLRARGEAVPDPPEMHVDAVDRNAPLVDEDPTGHPPHRGDDAAHGDAAAGGHAMRMPGMLTADQMAALDAAHGEEFDRLFLQFMIQHHEGALSMVDKLFATPGAAQEDAVFKLASDIGADQSSEITRMRATLAEMLVAQDP